MSRTIMIVDECASLRQGVGISLRMAGDKALEAGDAKDALSKLAGQEAGARPWVVKRFKPETLLGVVQKLVLR